MKTNVFKLFAVAIGLFLSPNLMAQTRYELLLQMLRSAGYSISTEQYADLQQGEAAVHTKSFVAGIEYAIVACSNDGDVTDLDIFVETPSGIVLYKDDDTSNLAIVRFSVSYTRDLVVRIKNYASRTPYYASRCRFVVAYRIR
jgi:hypothetical protein